MPCEHLSLSVSNLEEGHHQNPTCWHCDLRLSVSKAMRSKYLLFSLHSLWYFVRVVVKQRMRENARNRNTENARWLQRQKRNGVSTSLSRPTVDFENQKLEKEKILSPSLQEGPCPASTFRLDTSPLEQAGNIFLSLGLLC